MKTVIEKTGDAFIYIGIIRSKKLKDLVPEEAVVHKLFLGFSFYAVGIFKYDTIKDIRRGNKKYSWTDCFDSTIQVPIDIFNTKKLFFINRLYNTNPDIVQWAQGDYLRKIPSQVQWNENKSIFNIKINRIDGTKENIEVAGRKLFRLPNFFWKIPPLKSIATAFLVSKYEKMFYTFQGILDLEKSYIGTGRCKADGLNLPKPLFSLSLLIRNYNPLHIKPIFKLYHECEYVEKNKKPVKIVKPKAS